MPAVGLKAPAFTLRDGSGTNVSLSDFAGSNVVLYFYPRDDTPGCTIEAMQFTALKDAFAARDTVVLGISGDSVESHCRFAEKHGLGIQLLSDPSHATIEAYGAWQEKTLDAKKAMGIVRTTVLIDRSGAAARVWEKVKAEGHAQEVLAALR